MNNVHQRIQGLFAELKSEGHTQVQIANALGITQGAVSSYSRGDSLIAPPIAMLIESKFGYRKEWIINGELPKKVDGSDLKKEIMRITADGRAMQKVPEIMELIPAISKLPESDYKMLVEIIKKVIKK